MSVVDRIHGLDLHPNQRPRNKVVVIECGQLDLTRF